MCRSKSQHRQQHQGEGDAAAGDYDAAAEIIPHVKPPFPVASVAALSFALLSHGYGLTSLFPYVGYMVHWLVSLQSARSHLYTLCSL